MTWKLTAAAVFAVVAAIHGWALRRPAGKVHMMLHRIWHTRCFYQDARR